MVKAQIIRLKKKFVGFPKPSDVELVEEELPPLKDGEILAKAIYISVDPYMRAHSESHIEGVTLLAIQVALIIESKNADYPVGKYIVGGFGCRTYSNINMSKGGVPAGLKATSLWYPPYILPDIGDLPLSLSLGILGMPGQTAYFGFLEICKPKAGETVVVTCAAGAVGSIVGQIAKIKGCKVIGIAGTDEKVKLLKEQYNFDGAINYKKANLEEELKKYAPDGIDCYFDNVGGNQSITILKQMNLFGRVSICGCISEYNNIEPAKLDSVFHLILFNQLKVEGFIVSRWAKRLLEATEQNLKWIKEGKLKYHETVTNGFENLFTAFTSMLQGGNIGKAVVKV